MARAFQRILLVSLLCCVVVNVSAQVSPARYVAEVELHTVDELLDVLQRSEMLFDDGQLDVSVPVAIVLHGNEGRVFLRDGYDGNKQLVNLAAQLSALGAVDIQVCETWMGSQKLDAAMLQPFVGTVSFGPGEVNRLVKQENYIYF